jgi:hypothetical protein
MRKREKYGISTTKSSSVSTLRVNNIRIQVHTPCWREIETRHRQTLVPLWFFLLFYSSYSLMSESIYKKLPFRPSKSSEIRRNKSTSSISRYFFKRVNIDNPRTILRMLEMVDGTIPQKDKLFYQSHSSACYWQLLAQPSQPFYL